MEPFVYSAIALPVVFLFAAIFLARSRTDLNRFDQAVDACVRLITMSKKRYRPDDEGDV